jgi:gentisate 1,2-dioxygenase
MKETVMAVQTTRTVEELEEYCARLRAAGLDAPWSRPGPLIPPKPTATQPRHWRWRDIEPLLRESSEFLSPHRGAERRVLRLHNPGVPERTVAHSLVLAIQYLLPGEVAPAHRHSPTAVRFMLHGDGAFTTVDGQKCPMKPGDLVLTPGMAWHDHGNEGGAPVYWMDILDWQIVRFLENLTFEPYPDEQQPALRSPGRDIYFPWTESYAALQRRAQQDPDPFDDVLLEYVDPVSGSSLRPTVACYLQLLRPGMRTRAHRETSCAVYRVVQGRGTTTVGDQTFTWEPGDFFVIPPQARHAHTNLGAEPAVLFTAQDVPLLKLLRLYRMEPAD